MIIRIIWDKALSLVWLTKFIVVLTGIFVFVLCSLTVRSEWEDHNEVTIEETVYGTTSYVDRDHWLDQADRDSVQVIFKEEYYTLYTESSLGVGGKTDSLLYDTIRYYRK